MNDAELLSLTQGCFDKLQAVFRTKSEIFVYIANGHGGWEAVLSNLFAVGDCVLLPETGYFSNSWADSTCRIKAILAVHTDTAIGITSDITAIRRAIDTAGHPALLVVYAVASLGRVNSPWTIGRGRGLLGLQKALMGPPRLAFVAANAHARTVATATRRPRHYWDWDFRDGPEGYRRFCGTEPEHGIFALAAALDLLFEEGLDNVLARHARLAQTVRTAVGVQQDTGDLEFNVIDPVQRSNSATTILTPLGFPAGLVREHGRDRCSVSLGGGLGSLSGRAFRIGHLGDLNEPMILGALAAVELTLRELGINHGTGGVPRRDRISGKHERQSRSCQRAT